MKKMLSITTAILFCCMVMQAKSTVQKLDYTCDDKGIATINVTTAELKHIQILVDENTHLYCNPNTTTLEGCPNDKRKELKVLYEEDVPKQGLIGGKSPTYFYLRCDDNQIQLTANAVFNLSFGGENYKNQLKNLTGQSPKSLRLEISTKINSVEAPKTGVKIGDNLYLFMTGPDNHIVNPLECFAKPLGFENASSISIWKQAQTCDGYDAAIIDAKWNGTEKSISIRMYAFTFVNTDKVEITCKALVCPNTGVHKCDQVCVTHNAVSRRRRRNALIKPDSGVKSASTSFRVVYEKQANRAMGMTSYGVSLCYAGVLILALTFT